jgi:hypothetical protein
MILMPKAPRRMAFYAARFMARRNMIFQLLGDAVSDQLGIDFRLALLRC